MHGKRLRTWSHTVIAAVVLQDTLVQLVSKKLEWLLTLSLGRSLITLHMKTTSTVASDMISTALAITSTRHTSHQAHLMGSTWLLNSGRRLCCMSLLLLWWLTCACLGFTELVLKLKLELLMNFKLSTYLDVLLIARVTSSIWHQLSAFYLLTDHAWAHESISVWHVVGLLFAWFVLGIHHFSTEVSLISLDTDTTRISFLLRYSLAMHNIFL